ncbi:pimeloyl-ACP methyl ester esterase BioH [Methylomicrobium sp. Wu6]|uniref:pimeloyl-ACP methyl ester esterase BioH n=1 Tax=Methylomicrobium sp. Wu6 TaxID=3107928 RepID=UPI002DD62F80|nr:pimeloyl-ACP methyl ester esterase BioH [Methylomicrobium sp. Wu6]MEC4750574.1 pimeloyl-ACP methyl ester esterase BioH [Methylomicrobium sp. Wu6]
MTHLHTETYGHGKSIVMIHGWGMHTGIWRPFAKALARQYRVTCIDLPGHGRSGRISAFDLEHLGSALVAAVGDEPACWLGWSLGATVALDIASRFPERAEALILLAGNPRFIRTHDAANNPDHWPGVSPRVLDVFSGQLSEDAQQTLLRFLALQVHGLADTKALLKTLKAAVFECDPPDNTALRQGLKILKEADLRPALAAFDRPFAAILGGRDTLVPHAVGAHLQRLQPNLQLHLLEKAGHVPFLTHQEELIRLICGFMESR